MIKRHRNMLFFRYLHFLNRFRHPPHTPDTSLLSPDTQPVLASDFWYLPKHRSQPQTPTCFRQEVPSNDLISMSLAPLACIWRSAISAAFFSRDPTASVKTVTYFFLAKSPSTVAFTASSVKAPMIRNSSARSSLRIRSARGSLKGFSQRLCKTTWSYWRRISLGRSVHPSAL